jgi:hypothetical protein
VTIIPEILLPSISKKLFILSTIETYNKISGNECMNMGEVLSNGAISTKAPPFSQLYSTDSYKIDR